MPRGFFLPMTRTIFLAAWRQPRGRPGRGWKITPGQALYQYAPTKIARIFRLAFFPPQSPGKTPTALPIHTHKPARPSPAKPMHPYSHPAHPPEPDTTQTTYANCKPSAVAL